MLRKRNQQVSQQLPNKPVKYPKWTFAKTDSVYWLILDKTKMKFISERACLSWGKPYVLATQESLSNYQTWKEIGFAPGSMIRSMDGLTWFLTGSNSLEAERRLINTPDFYSILGFNYYNAILVSQDELLFHKKGVDINNV